MKVLYELKEKGFEELEELKRKGKMSASDWEAIHHITGAMKNIDKICDHEEQGNSRGGEWEGKMRGSYEGGNSGRHYVRGHYSRDDGSYGGGSYNGGSSYENGGYSGRGYSRGEDMREKLEHMMREAGSEEERRALKRCMEEIRG